MAARNIILGFLFLWSQWTTGQNLVPNPSFENMNACDFITPDISCLQFWSDSLALDLVNTPDLGYEGAVFFPPSTIAAFDGNQYLNLECSTGNPEYIQVNLLQPLVAGTTYCVSFYASHSQESPVVAPSMGVYFTDTPITNSPFELGLQAHVQGPVDFDPTSWTLVSGTFTAAGGESIMVVSGFENTGTMPFPYMYVDMLSVVPMPPLVLADIDLCDTTALLDASAPGASFQWSNGATTASISVNTEGIYSVTRTIGACSQSASAEVLACDTIIIIDPVDTIPVDTLDQSVDSTTVLAYEDYLFYIPNAFSPNDDGVNDAFGVVGPVTDNFLLQIFNRWGQLVFESADINKKWIANHSGGAHYVPDGVYIYKMKATDGKFVFERSGHVVLVR